MTKEGSTKIVNFMTPGGRGLCTRAWPYKSWSENLISTAKYTNVDQTNWVWSNDNQGRVYQNCKLKFLTSRAGVLMLKCTISLVEGKYIDNFKIFLSKLILFFVTKQAQCSLFKWRPCPFSNGNFSWSKPICLLHVHIIVVLLNMWQCLLRIVSHLSNATPHLLKSKASHHVLFFLLLKPVKA